MTSAEPQLTPPANARKGAGAPAAVTTSGAPAGAAGEGLGTEATAKGPGVGADAPNPAPLAQSPLVPSLRTDALWHVWRALRHPSTTLRSSGDYLLHQWRTSIQVRVIGSVFLSSLLVVLALGFVLTSFVSQQLLDAKYSASLEELDRARTAVEEQVAATDNANPLAVRLSSARAVLADRSTGVDQGTSAVFEPVLIAQNSNGEEVSVPEGFTVPVGLRYFVRQGQVSFQYTTIHQGATPIKALIVGTPVASDIPGLELYLVLPLTAEEQTLTLMRGLLLAGGIVLLVLLVVIAWVFSQQLTVPVRSASRIAERFSAGHLRERMVVDGQDEVAKLAMSFNEMAESISTQIRNLEEFGSLQKQFTSDVSHELRTPLTTVRMAADLIHDNAEDLDPMARRASELMNKELDRFESLLGDLLEISRHDAGQANLSAEKIDVRGVVKSSLAQVRAIAEAVGTTLVVDLPPKAVTAEIDSRRVERILRNLLANAVDHCEGKPITVSLAADRRCVAVTVVDRGVGLKPGEEELVFNRFWRSDPSRERRTGGTGLGLAIALQDAQLHGGTLEAIGEPGVGSCFRLTLPLVAGAPFTGSPLPLEVPSPELPATEDGGAPEGDSTASGVETPSEPDADAVQKPRPEPGADSELAPTPAETPAQSAVDEPTPNGDPASVGQPATTPAPGGARTETPAPADPTTSPGAASTTPSAEEDPTS